MNLSIRKYFFISSGVFISWILFEYWIDACCRRKLKNILKKNIKSIYSMKYASFYEKSLSGIFEELSNSQDILKDHIQNSMKKTFSSISSFGSLQDRLISYQKNRKEMNIRQLLKIENMLWYPYSLRFMFSCFNDYFLYNCGYKYKVKQIIYRDHYIYMIEPKEEKIERTILIFPGLGGILSHFDKLFDLLIKKKYKIIVPMYGPTQASLKYNFDCHECIFYNDIHDFLINNNITEIDLIAWSLGGILYKGFEKYNNTYFLPINQEIKINKIILFEPLLGMRACIDTYFSKLRKPNRTLSIFNCITSEKYEKYNNIFSYFIHSVVGYSTANSFGYFTSTELKKSYFNPNRYLFISSEDVIINDYLDKELIDSNFDNSKVFKRKGYHGGWLQSSQLNSVLEKII